jgi:retron-type reverse transcriptase
VGVKPANVPEHRPKIDDIYDIARYLDVSPEIIRYIRRNKSKNYNSFTFRKKAGGERQIDAPRTFLKVIQWWILDTILSHVVVGPHVFGFVRGKNYIDNAKEHLSCTNLLNVDIKDFFPSVNEAAVIAVFMSLGYSGEVAAGLADLTTLNGVLPQGAPSSPALANLVFAKLDTALSQYAEGNGLTYTRYADDLTFSSTAYIDRQVVEAIQSILLSGGFVLNTTKTKFMGVNEVKEVTGLVITPTGVALPRRYLNQTRAWFYKVGRFPLEHAEDELRIRGTIELLKQVGGRGTDRLIASGRHALNAIDVATTIITPSSL